MGYPNPHESEYDLFMTGHAGASVSTALGLMTGDHLREKDKDRWSVAVIGDGEGRHTELFGRIHEPVHTTGAVKQAVLCVQM